MHQPHKMVKHTICPRTESFWPFCGFVGLAPKELNFWETVSPLSSCGSDTEMTSHFFLSYSTLLEERTTFLSNTDRF